LLSINSVITLGYKQRAGLRRDEGGGMRDEESKAVFSSFFSFIPHPSALIPSLAGTAKFIWPLTWPNGNLFLLRFLILEEHVKDEPQADPCCDEEENYGQPRVAEDRKLRLDAHQHRRPDD
jgi:hypothetical protein